MSVSVSVLPPQEPAVSWSGWWTALELTFLSITNSFSAAVRLCISSSYLWEGPRREGVGRKA